MELDDQTLSRAQAGDQEAQTAFLERFSAPLRQLVRRLAGQGDAEDVLQDVLVQLLRVLPRFRREGPAQLSTWVFTVAHRVLLMERRRKRPLLVALDGGAAHEPADPAPGGEEQLHQRRLRQAFEAAVAALPAAQQRVFVLAHLHGQPLEAVAQAEGVPVGTVKSRLHRARAELVVALGELLDQAKEVSVAARR